MAKRFRAREGKPINDRDAQIIGKFLETQFPDGRFRPIDVVNAAKPKNSPIHKYFEWDNTRAAELYRKRQAREIIRSIVVVIDGEESPEYVNVKIPKQTNFYMKTSEARKVPDIWNVVLERALLEAESWQSRYERFEQLTPIFKALDKTRKEIKNGKGKAKKRK